MKDLEAIKGILREQVALLKNEYEIEEIGVFGSYVTGEQKDSSDVDILVEFRRSVDLFTFVHLKNALSELLGLQVDLVMRKALKPSIGKNVLRQVVYI